jgi:hypothetical protein
MKKIISLALLLSLNLPAFAGVLSEEDVLKNISVTKHEIPLTSRLKKRYEAYKISVTNNYSSDLRLSSGNVDNSVSGAVAANSVSVGWGNIFWGLPLWLLGIGIAACVINSKNHHSENEGMSYAGSIPNTVIGKGETINFNTLVPIGQEPNVKLKMSTLD